MDATICYSNCLDALSQHGGHAGAAGGAASSRNGFARLRARAVLSPLRLSVLGAAVSTSRIRASAAAISAQGFGEESSPAAETTEAQLPEKLREIVRLFEAVPDARARYEQLMHYAKKLKPLAEEFHNKENKVVGCVSQVWVRAFLGPDSKVYFEADSDSILTKGLAALLVEGLSGCSPQEIVRLTPTFIQMLGLKQSLTPSRSNGFYNMFKLMQKKTLQLYMGADGEGSSSASATPDKVNGESTATTAVVPQGDGSGPVAPPASGEQSASRRSVIQRRLEEGLSPSLLEVEDVSHQHAGHAAVRGAGGETHFNVKVVSAEFEGRSLVKRHRLVYDLLQDELNSGLHALSIVAKTPAEFGKAFHLSCILNMPGGYSLGYAEVIGHNNRTVPQGVCRILGCNSGGMGFTEGKQDPRPWLRKWIQGKLVWYEVTFGMYMLEWWERCIINLLVLLLIWVFLYNGVCAAVRVYSLTMQVHKAWIGTWHKSGTVIGGFMLNEAFRIRH